MPGKESLTYKKSSKQQKERLEAETETEPERDFCLIKQTTRVVHEFGSYMQNRIPQRAEHGMDSDNFVFVFNS